MSAVAGLRRLAANGLTWDASASYGAHQSDFFFNNTVNASLGPDTPRDFNPGLYRQEEVGLNVDVAYAATEMVNVAGGAEWRDERFEVGAGGRPSWEVGPYAAQGFVPASNGFPGFAAEDITLDLTEAVPNIRDTVFDGGLYTSLAGSLSGLTAGGLIAGDFFRPDEQQ